MTHATTVGVVVIAADRDEHLARLLDGLAEQARRADRVVVVDMAGTADLTTGAPFDVERVAVARDGSTLPLGAARNAGAAALGCDVTVFLDVDCIPHPSLVADYAAALTARPDVLACGRVRYLCEGWSGTTPAMLDACSTVHAARPTPAVDELDTQRHELFWSLNFAVTATTWGRLGGFDPSFRGYGAEDTDLGLRARQLDIPLLWVAGALAYHQWHPPTRRDPSRTPELVANARRFHRRWGSWPMRGWLDELAADGAVTFDPEHGVLEVR
jgi:GT2 family glycosyltransferase